MPLSIPILLWMVSFGGGRSMPAPAVVYEPVLEHVTRERPVRLLRPVTLAEQVYRPDCHAHCEQGTGSVHDPRTLRELRRRSAISLWCRVPDGRAGCGPPENIFVALGPILHLGPGVRVLPILDLPVGTRYQEAAAAITDDEKVFANAAVDVMLSIPCREESDPDGCRVSNITMYRYFLQSLPGGKYKVVARIQTGAV